MKCCKCGRALSKVKLILSGLPIGDTCAKKHGLITQAKPKKRKAKNPKFTAPEIERCPLTLDMFHDE